MRKLAAAVGVLAAVSVVAVAQGAVVQEFNFQLKDVKPDGRYTVVFTSRSFDAAGGIPDHLTQNYVRLPKGAVVRKRFLNNRYYCDLKKFVDMLRTTHPNPPHFNDLVNQTLRGKRTPPKNAKSLIAVCRFAHVGGGTALVDARPFVDQPIPAHFEMFWSKPNPGAVGTFAIVGSADETNPVVAQNPTIRDTHPILRVDFVDDPTPDGLYEYKLVLPTGPIAGINVSFAEVRATTQGLTLTRKARKCVKRRGGRCAKRKLKTTNLFWFARPTCPPTGRLSFQGFYAYANSPQQTKTIELPLPEVQVAAEVVEAGTPDAHL